jgi:hypothetical protein
LKRLLLTLVLIAGSASAASAQITGPLSPAPPQTGVTSRLLFNAMMATAKAAAAGNGAAAQAARVNYESAIRLRAMGNSAAARVQAINAINEAGAAAPGPGPIRSMNAYTAPYIGETPTAAQTNAITHSGTVLPSGPAKPMQPYTAPNVPQTVLVPGTVASINADAFVAAARGSVNACAAAHSPMTGIAKARLAQAESANAAGQYGVVVANAQDIVDLCATAQAATQAP